MSFAIAFGCGDGGSGSGIDSGHRETGWDPGAPVNRHVHFARLVAENLVDVDLIHAGRSHLAEQPEREPQALSSGHFQTRFYSAALP